MFKKILVTLDGSEQAKHALIFGVNLAERDGAELVILSVVPLAPLFVTEETEFSYYPQFVNDMERYHGELLSETIRELQIDHKDLKISTVLKKGNPARNIVEVATEQEVDLIVIGNRGTGGIVSWMLGSTSRSVAEACTVPVLIVKDREYCEA